MSKKKKKKRVSNSIGGLLSSIRYDRKSNTVTLSIHGHTHIQAQALYLFASLGSHPKVQTSGKLEYAERSTDKKIVDSKYRLTTSVAPNSGLQYLLEDPDMCWLPPEGDDGADTNKL